ncbi:hypothetical protein [Piscirickettsia salmonis]|uniref:hypothetical protein n=1 Tax=Piscirickettsia salmonis TaxID=1238 RepID=UPI0007C97388|nr:hypothetical protein A0O36_02669 [Piscirickettsiaceae bacterium NZ-RLO1]
MPKNIFIFDIDETLLCHGSTLIRLNPLVMRTLSSYDPYNTPPGCYVLHKEKITAIMQGIVSNGDAIGFITAGGMEKEAIKEFYNREYGINLGDRFEFYNRMQSKLPSLQWIAESNRTLKSNVIFVDNCFSHIESAYKQGFTVVYADNNCSDTTYGAQYIEQLESIVTERSRQLAQADVNSQGATLMFGHHADDSDDEAPPLEFVGSAAT